MVRNKARPLNKSFENIDRIFRKSYGRIVARLLSKYGLSELDLIENATMEAFYKALKVFTYDSNIPDKLEGWLYVVAQRNLIDEFRKKSRKNLDINALRIEGLESCSNERLDHAIDEELELLFTICHPKLRPSIQLAFMLKTLGGLGIKEIAAALLVPVETVRKRLQRARKFIRDENLSFEMPSERAMGNRIDQVNKTLYLLYNEGYYPTAKAHLIRKDMCQEALRLCKSLSEQQYATSDTLALMSLMCYHTSRIEARIDNEGMLIPLEQQDRSKWSPFFRGLGDHYLDLSIAKRDDKSIYQVEAAISAAHCHAPSYADTKWEYLLLLYQYLYKLKPQPQVLLNQAVILLRLEKLKEAKSLYENLDENKFGSDKMHYFMVGAEIYRALQQDHEHMAAIQRLLHSTQNADQLKWIQLYYQKSQ